MEDINETSQTTMDAVSTEVQVQATEVQEEQIDWVEGVTISAVGMSIVFFGLILTFCYISSLPYISGEKRKAKKANAETVASKKTTTTASSEDLDPGLNAAIAYVIAAEHEYERLSDYTKITIRRDENQQVWGVAGKMRTLATRKISKM